MLPQIPSWDSMHPLVVHFPIALVLIAPIFVVLSVILRKSARPLAACALLLMALGTAGAMAAVSTGEAGAELAERVAGVDAAIDKHEDLAETTRTMLIVVTVVYALIVLAPFLSKRILDPIPSVALNGSFLVLYVVAATFLVNTAHQGGVLVHTYGVHAMLGPAAPSANAAPSDDDDKEAEEHERK
ncbi:MAG: hypothetical protein HZB26_01620 [Candidatus Hydrogenedentes bacterium]|nr:hypothetical protein [Candidatus Hydrogenedentota bacterium]